jgi:four helix bundle protein
MAKVLRFEDLEIWKLARAQFQNISCISKQINPDLSRQIFRSAGSVMDNIAEGFGRGGRKEFKNFLIISKGSNLEVKSQLYRIQDSEIISKILIDELHNNNDLLSRKISSLIKYLKFSDRSGPNY